MDDTHEPKLDQPTEATAEEAEPERVYLDKEVIAEMRRLGMDRPKGLPVSEWIEPQSLNHRHDEIITLMLRGFSKKRIADVLGMDYNYLVTITNSPMLMKVYYEKRADRDLASSIDRKRVNTYFEDALDTMEKVMLDPREKGNVRADAAKFLIEQAIGKAKQDVEVKGSVLLDVMHSIQELREAKQATALPAVDKPKSIVDSFVDEFMAENNFVVGKRSDADGEESE